MNKRLGCMLSLLMGLLWGGVVTDAQAFRQTASIRNCQVDGFQTTHYDPWVNWSDPRPIDGAWCHRGPDLAVFSSLLYLVHGGRSTDNLYYAFYNNQTGRWSSDDRIRGQTTRSKPAVAAYGNYLMLAHIGASNDDLYWSIYPDDDFDWSPDVKVLPSQKSESGPALAVLNNTVYMIYRGSGHDRHIHFSTYGAGPTPWTRPVVTGHESPHGPALAVHHNVNLSPPNLELHMVYTQRQSGHHAFRHVIFNPSTHNFGYSVPVPDFGFRPGASRPALASLDGWLHMVYRGTNNQLYHTRSQWDGQSARYVWRQGSPILPATARPARRSPALAVYANRQGVPILHLVYRAENSRALMHVIYPCVAD